jgi:hypothetical protein
MTGMGRIYNQGKQKKKLKQEVVMIKIPQINANNHLAKVL